MDSIKWVSFALEQHFPLKRESWQKITTQPHSDKKCQISTGIWQCCHFLSVEILIFLQKFCYRFSISIHSLTNSTRSSSVLSDKVQTICEFRVISRQLTPFSLFDVEFFIVMCCSSLTVNSHCLKTWNILWRGGRRWSRIGQFWCIGGNPTNNDVRWPFGTSLANCANTDSCFYHLATSSFC